MLLFLTLTLLADIAPPLPKPRPPPPVAECTADDQCVLSTFNGCCPGCCQPDPHAVRRGTREGEQCAAVECARPNCSAVRCAQPRPVSDFVAACRANRCVAVPKTQPQPAECRADSECKVVEALPPPGAACHQSACGCCPVSRAVPLDVVVPLPQRDGPKPSTPPFGLSTGDARAPACSPCPAPQPGRAACQSGRCVLQPTERRPLPPG
ncbi:MAG: hypothetical protein ACOZQL_23605 [Myxococcota bacterium]